MEPATVQPLTEEQLDGNENDFDDGNDTIEDDMNELKRDEGVQAAVQELQHGILALKRQLFMELVSNDTKHTPDDLGPMMTFHSLFLQVIGYWIGLLDHSPVPAPNLQKPSIQKGFKSLTNAIEKVSQANLPASRVLVYEALRRFSTQHPYELGPVENSLDE
jgi:hypothetical protein